ncbi:MAG TPA: tetratricopeptide repeat protein [Clostridiales bacterium]|nr:tetratricopeptide repeat protein [Clostridiales bacterium]
MTRPFTLILLILPAMLLCLPITDFDEANQYYEKADYEKASVLYEKIISDGFENGEVYYNLGNSYYKLGDIARSILYYERAVKLMPDDPDLTENLKIARLYLTDKVEETEAEPFFTLYSDIRNSFNIYTSKNILLILILITGIFISTYIFLKNTLFGRFFFYISLISAASLMFFSYLYYDIHSLDIRRFGVVSEDKISVMSSPDDNINSKELFFLHLGTKAEIVRSNEQWLEIRLDEEKKGWVKKESLIEI